MPLFPQLSKERRQHPWPSEAGIPVAQSVLVCSETRKEGPRGRSGRWVPLCAHSQNSMGYLPHGLINIFVLLDWCFCPTCETVLFTEPVNLVSAHCPRGQITLAKRGNRRQYHKYPRHKNTAQILVDLKSFHQWLWTVASKIYSQYSSHKRTEHPLKGYRDDFANLRRESGCPESKCILDTLTLGTQIEARGHFLRLTTYLVGQEQAGHGLSTGQCELAV